MRPKDGTLLFYPSHDKACVVVILACSTRWADSASAQAVADIITATKGDDAEILQFDAGADIISKRGSLGTNI